MSRPMLSPCNVNVWPQAIPMSGKTVALHGQLHGPTTWNHVNPMCGKAVPLHEQIHESANVKPMQCQCVENSGFFMCSFMDQPE